MLGGVPQARRVFGEKGFVMATKKKHDAYRAYVESKLQNVVPTGIDDAVVESPHLFDFQREIAQCAIRRGRCAIFADTGLGKTRMQLVYAMTVAEHTGLPVLVLCPLSVAKQTSAEGDSLGIPVQVVRRKEDMDLSAYRIFATNYERLHLLDASAFGAVVLDESSILKNHDSKTLKTVMQMFADTPFKLCLTATPSPNDYVELGTHAEFLGICTQTEMLAEYFVHDGGETQKWRLKGHARSKFWKFVASWAILIRSPEDLGYDGSAYVLPDLLTFHCVAAADEESTRAAGLLFAQEASTLMERRTARKASIGMRVKLCADMVNASDEPWIVWCDLNAESEALARAIPDAVEVTGSLDADEKESRIWSFLNGERRVIIGKPSIFGFGINAQFCARMAFVGVTDSWEAYYQAVRRCYRFGQKRPVEVYIFASELEGAVIRNLARKEADAKRMADELSRETADAVRASIAGTSQVTNAYDAHKKVKVPSWAAGG